MSKKGYLILLVVCVLVSLAGLASLAAGIAQRGFGKVNYGALIPVAIGVWSFIKWKKAA